MFENEKREERRERERETERSHRGGKERCSQHLSLSPRKREAQSFDLGSLGERARDTQTEDFSFLLIMRRRGY